MNIFNAVALLGLSFIFIIGMSLVFAFPTMWLWNYVMPDISKGAIASIDFWHALAINFLSGILFKSTITKNNKKN